LSALKDILALSESMLSAAQAADWSEVEALERRRRPLLNACFPAPAEPHLASLHAPTVQRLLDIDCEVRALAEAARDDVAGELERMSRGRRATRAYGQHNAR
jgi:hypothetical protein